MRKLGFFFAIVTDDPPMIASYPMNEYNFVFLRIKTARLSPSKVVHLVNERALSGDCTDQVN